MHRGWFLEMSLVTWTIWGDATVIGDRLRVIGCLHDPANVQQTSSKCIQNTRANAGRLLDSVNIPLTTTTTTKTMHLLRVRNAWIERLCRLPVPSSVCQSINLSFCLRCQRSVAIQDKLGLLWSNYTNTLLFTTKQELTTFNGHYALCCTVSLCVSKRITKMWMMLNAYYQRQNAE